MIELCGWMMPADSAVGPQPCVRETGHDGDHVIMLTGGRKTVMLYEVDEERRRMRERAHAQVKPPFTRQDAAALYELLEFIAERRAGGAT